MRTASEVRVRFQNDRVATNFPEGTEYWQYSRRLEDECATLSVASLDADWDGVVSGLGTVTSLLYRLASCYWGCHGKEHVFEYIAGRTCTSAHSAYRLMGFGYYDAAPALARNIAEIGNLVHSFFSDNSHIRTWLDSPDKLRRQEYSPINVRKALEALGAVVPTDQDRYSWLCEVGTHVTPQTLPQAHNEESRPILGAVFQKEGWRTSLESLTWSVCTVLAPLAKLAILDRKHAERLFEESVALVKAL